MTSSWALRRIIHPPVEPLTTEEARHHCRVDITEDNEYLDTCVIAAREHIEEVCSRALVEQRWRLTMDRWPHRPITLWRPPIIRIVSVRYIDTSGDSQLLDPDQYQVDTESEPGRLMPAFGLCWPSVRCQLNAVQIEYDAGYASDGSPADASKVPEPIKRAMRMLVGHWYENREAIGNVTGELQFAVSALLAPFRIHSF